MKLTVMPNGRLDLPAEVLRRHGLEHGGDVVLEETENGITLRTLDQILDRARALSRELLTGHPDASVDDFLAERAQEAEMEDRRW